MYVDRQEENTERITLYVLNKGKTKKTQKAFAAS